MARGESQKTPEGDWRQPYSERRFGVLLVILAVLLAGPPVLLGFGLSAAWFDGLMALLLVANLDVPVTPYPLRDGGEQLLDGVLFCGRLDHAPAVGLSVLLQVALVGSLHLGEFPVDGDLDAEFFQVRE